MTVASISWSPVPVGLVAWVASMVLVPAPLAARLLLGVPLVLAPRLAPALAVAGARRSSGTVAAPAAAWPWLAVGAGVLVALSLARPTGSPLAGALATPWWLLALGGVFAWVARLRSERTWAPTVAGLARVTADVALFTGATALLCDRLALTPLGFSPAIILLTAVHFSVAGYGLVAIAALLAAQGSGAGRLAVVGLALGLPMTAVGFVADSPVAGWPGTVVVAGSGLLVAGLLARSGAHHLPGRLRRVGAAAGLAVGMVLAIGWSTALVAGVPYLDIAAMVRSHGTLNLGAVLLAAWVLTGTPVPIASTARPVLPTLGAAVALGIGAVVALLLLRAGPDAIDSAWPIAALVGPTVTAWWVGRWHRTALERPVAATVAMAVGTIHVAAAATVLILAIEGGDLGVGIAGAAIMLAFGIVLGGFLVLIATGPCAVLWLALLRLFAPRPAPAAPGIVR